MDNTIIKQNLNADLYDYGRVHARAAYFQLYGKLASCIELFQINTEKAYDKIVKTYKEDIIQEISNTEVYANKTNDSITYTLLILKNEIMIEVGDNYCELYFSGKASETILNMKKSILKCKSIKKKPLELNLISTSNHGFRLNTMEVKRSKLDLDLYYEDDFKEVHKLIKKRLSNEQDKGLVLLHGLPGTGKTTYLRYLVGKLKKKVMFVPPNLASQIGNPDFIKLLVNNPESILIIEDAENIIMQRQSGKDSSVSNLLNICDGLLSDFLSIQVICTFNSPLSTVDEALLRDGRLIAKYEFNKLSVEKAKALAQKKGIEKTITEPMTIAEITSTQKVKKQEQTQQIGFRVQTA